jgi:hypothetical protein
MFSVYAAAGRHERLARRRASKVDLGPDPIG